MIDRISWQDAFRATQAPQAVRALCMAWHELVEGSPDTFNAKKKEPELTSLLAEYLRAIKARTKLTGHWIYENRIGTLARTSPKGLKITLPKRTDIQFCSDRGGVDLDLVFEFKKLGHTGAKRTLYAGPEGMDRFVTGEYSLRQPVALMVGILVEHIDDCVPPLVRWLNSAEAKVALHMETTGSGQIRSPSHLFAGDAHFDTEHMRPIGKGPDHHTIVISHLFLGFPDLPRASAKRQRRQAINAALESVNGEAA